MNKSRKITQAIQRLTDHHKVVILTGARQTGKTTLARLLFKDYQFISVEDPVLRQAYTRMTSEQWNNSFPKAILDEVQKEPVLIESIKAVYDQYPKTMYVLTGSSQFQLMKNVRESLAGRCQIFELYPFTLPEMQTTCFDEDVPDSVWQELLRHAANTDKIDGKIKSLMPSFMLDPWYARKMEAWGFYKKFGAYPALFDENLDEEGRYFWLKNYVMTYLERDVRDMASMRDLEPFVKLQQYVALQTGQMLNMSSLGKQIGVTSKTVQKYITYFEMSYQMITLQAWSKNEGKRLVKTPKIHYLDHGILQAVLVKRGGMTGSEFESLVIAEIYKQTKALSIEARFYYLRTQDGAEVDLLVEVPSGYFAFEIRMAEHVGKHDAKHLNKLEEFLDKPLLHAFVVSHDTNISEIGQRCLAIHAAYLLG
jgi:predicted AAA+ superfamily ATPase